MPSINKVVYGNRTLLDLTSDTVTAGTMLSGTTAHSASGESITGTFAVETNKAITVSDDTVITPSSGYNAMSQVSVTVDVPGGISIPEFTVTFSNGTPVSVTTTWSYSDCEDFISDYDNEYMYTAIVHYEGDGYDSQAFVASAVLHMGQINYEVFTDSAPYADIAFMYKSNGTFEFYTPFEALSLTATQNGTYTTGYTNKFYDEVIVNVPSGGSPTIQSLTVTPTTSQQTFNASGVDGYKPVTVNAMPSGTATAPTSISGTSASVSTGTNTLTLTKSVSVTPRITTAGYVSSGTAGNSSVSLTASVTTKAAATITPNTSAQTIPSGTYLTGTQTIAGDVNLVGSNIISGKSIFGVSGTVVINKYYTGSTDPASSLGSDGDIYLKV